VLNHYKSLQPEKKKKKKSTRGPRRDSRHERISPLKEPSSIGEWGRKGSVADAAEERKRTVSSSENWLITRKRFGGTLHPEEAICLKGHANCSDRGGGPEGDHRGLASYEESPWEKRAELKCLSVPVVLLKGEERTLWQKGRGNFSRTYGGKKRRVPEE